MNNLKLDRVTIKKTDSLFYIIFKGEKEKKGNTFFLFRVKNRKQNKVKNINIPKKELIFHIKDNLLYIKNEDLFLKYIDGSINILDNNNDIKKEKTECKQKEKVEKIKPVTITDEEVKAYQKIKEDKRVIKTYEFIKKELPALLHKIRVETEFVFNPETGKMIYNEESYYREIGKIYKFSYIQKRFKELIYFYKKDENLPYDAFPVSDGEKTEIKNLLILCNMGIVLKVLDGIVPKNERNEGKEVGTFIAEGMSTIVESIDKFQMDFTAEKSTKDTSIKLININDDNSLDVELISNKPFSNIDVTIEDKEQEVKEELNIEINWEEIGGGKYKTNCTIDALENDYTESEKIKLSVSKKVGHPSTFITTNVFYALKNFLNKREVLKISNNFYVLNSQIKRIKGEYEELFHKEPTDRWLAYYLLTQNRTIKEVNKEKYEDYNNNNKNEDNKEIDYFFQKQGKKYFYLTKNENTTRLLMMKTKGAKDKNKNCYCNLKENIKGNEDEFLYFDKFEHLLLKKEREIQKARLSFSGVVSLDQELEDFDNTSVGDFLGDTEQLNCLLDSMTYSYQKEEFVQKLKTILCPKEYFYVGLYLLKKIDLENIAAIGFYSNGSIEIRKILKRAFSKISFYIKYKNVLYKSNINFGE